MNKRLVKEGFKPSFIKALKAKYEDRHFLQVLELNVLLFLRKSDYHGIQVTGEAKERVRGFLKANKAALKKAEKNYRVSPPVIASLLWIESRHGQNTGQFHVPSVYLHLLQAPRPEVVAHLQRNAKQFTDHVTKKNRKDIDKRTKTKSDWALAELRALQTMFLRDKKALHELRGSFSGAFGMPQFLPSSYVSYAKAFNSKRPADLTRPDDAIQSVANYLHKSGWKPGKKKTYSAALFRYNKSTDYGNAILKLADLAEPPKQRAPAAKAKSRR
ncbi:MAG: hypothetical protein HC902_06100 [Calothrix sp. SM1_5_4]|nr:hypothetical protein [Calothrix sp. SM1_5_4]